MLEMWSNLLSAALLYGLSTAVVVVAGIASLEPQGAPVSGDPETTFSPSLQVVKTTPTQDPGNKMNPTGGGPTVTSMNQDKAGRPSASDSAGDGSLSGSGGKKGSAGAIAGGVVGGILFLLLVGALVFFLRRRKRARNSLGSVEKSADETVTNYGNPTPPLPVPAVAAPVSLHPHHNPAAPNEAHALMSHYGDTQPQQMPQEVQPVIMPAKPYDVNSSSREIRDGDGDDDGISINSPSPVTTPSPEQQQEQQRSVPRLPIYQGGRKGDVGGNTPPPAL